jgi:hypothetical protein
MLAAPGGVVGPESGTSEDGGEDEDVVVVDSIVVGWEGPFRL